MRCVAGKRHHRYTNTTWRTFFVSSSFFRAPRSLFSFAFFVFRVSCARCERREYVMLCERNRIRSAHESLIARRTSAKPYARCPYGRETRERERESVETREVLLLQVNGTNKNYFYFNERATRKQSRVDLKWKFYWQCVRRLRFFQLNAWQRETQNCAYSQPAMHGMRVRRTANTKHIGTFCARIPHEIIIINSPFVVRFSFLIIRYLCVWHSWLRVYVHCVPVHKNAKK